MKKVATIIISGVLAVALTGCATSSTSSSSSSSVQTVSESASKEPVEFIDSEDNEEAIAGLTEWADYNGLRFLVNPAWKSETYDGTLKYTVSSSAIILAEVYKSNIKLGVGVIREEERDGWTLTVQQVTSSGGYRETVATGNVPNGRAFQITFNQGNDATTGGLSTGVVDAIIDSIQFTSPTTETTAQTPSTSQLNALRRAQSYLNSNAFSYARLIEQLEYEQFSHDDAVYAADNVGADWNEQALKKAKRYLDMNGYSRGRLIDQLEYEGFTTEQATYAVDQIGL